MFNDIWISCRAIVFALFCTHTSTHTKASGTATEQSEPGSANREQSCMRQCWKGLRLHLSCIHIENHSLAFRISIYHETNKTKCHC